MKKSHTEDKDCRISQRIDDDHVYGLLQQQGWAVVISLIASVNVRRFVVQSPGVASVDDVIVARWQIIKPV